MVWVGGITPCLEIAALARAWGVPLAPRFMMELSGQLLCCLPNAHIFENVDGGSLTDLGALVEPIRIEDGWFTPPDGPATASSSTATSSPRTRSSADAKSAGQGFPARRRSGGPLRSRR